MRGSSANAAAVSNASSSPTPTSASTADMSSVDQELLQFVNTARVSAGLRPLTVNATLQSLALVKAQDMVTYGYFAHYSPRLGWPYQMETNVGYRAAAMGAENAAEAASAARAFAMFRGSPTHWANIMDPVFAVTGIAVVPIPGGVLVEELFSGQPNS